MAFELLPEGTYKGRVFDWGFSQLSTGTEFFFLRVRLDQYEGSSGDMEDIDPAPREVKFWFNDNDDNVRRSASALKSLGLGVTLKEFADDPAGQGEFLRDKEILVNITHGIDNRGRPQENVNLSRRPVKMDGERRKDFAAKYGRVFDETMKGSKAPKKAEPAVLPFR